MPQPLQFDSMKYDFEIQWSRDAFPIDVIIDKNLPEHLQWSVAYAISTWNVTVGEEIFTLRSLNFKRNLPETPCGWIAVVQDDNMEHDGLWRGRYHEDHIVCAAQISLKSLKEVKERVRNNIVVHEFGHALGLAHDQKDISSIMHPYIWNDLYQYITDEDVQAVREHYFNP